MPSRRRAGTARPEAFESMSQDQVQIPRGASIADVTRGPSSRTLPPSWMPPGPPRSSAVWPRTIAAKCRRCPQKRYSPRHASSPGDSCPLPAAGRGRVVARGRLLLEREGGPGIRFQAAVEASLERAACHPSGGAVSPGGTRSVLPVQHHVSRQRQRAAGGCHRCTGAARATGCHESADGAGSQKEDAAAAGSTPAPPRRGQRNERRKEPRSLSVPARAPRRRARRCAGCA